MKNLLLLSCFFALLNTAVSQNTNINFGVQPTYKHAIHKEKLSKAQSMGHLLESYPSEWISKYISTEVQTTTGKISSKAKGTNETLSQEQIALLNNVQLGTEVRILINYEYKNPVTGLMERNKIDYKATVMPENEAQYPGGKNEMTAYLKEYAISKLPEMDSKKEVFAIIYFTVDETGAISSAKLSRSSGNSEVEKLLLDAIKQMPKWSPAQTSDGIKVKQTFEFRLNAGGGC